jgi:hypothetical protein
MHWAWSDLEALPEDVYQVLFDMLIEEQQARPED